VLTDGVSLSSKELTHFVKLVKLSFHQPIIRRVLVGPARAVGTKRVYAAVECLEDFRMCGQPAQSTSPVPVGVLKGSINGISGVLEIGAPELLGHLCKRIQCAVDAEEDSSSAIRPNQKPPKGIGHVYTRTLLIQHVHRCVSPGDALDERGRRTCGDCELLIGLETAVVAASCLEEFQVHSDTCSDCTGR